MGMRNVIGKAIDSAFKAVGDIAVPMTYRHYSQQPTTRDPNTGNYTRPFAETKASGIYADIKILEGRANVSEAERVILMRRSEVPVYSIGDFIFHEDKSYEVLQNVPDPTEQLWQFAVRSAKPKVS